VLAECRDGCAAVRAIEEHRPDLIFLDVQMPEMSGFDVLAAVEPPTRMPAVIFVTAYDRFALQAFEAQAVDYLLKPFGEERVRKALERVRKFLGGDTQRLLQDQIAGLLRATAATCGAPCVLVRQRGRVLVLRPNEIDWIEAYGDYESSTWRNAYLLGAQELRSGVRGGARRVPGVSPDMLHAMPIALVFDYLGTRVDGPRAGPANIVINWRFTDTHESLVSTLEHGALTWITGKTASNAVTTVTTTRTAFESVILGQRTLADAMEHREIMAIGDAKAVSHLLALLVDFETGFPVVEPGR
jgi:CheY-like chemotaxis protein